MTELTSEREPSGRPIVSVDMIEALLGDKQKAKFTVPWGDTTLKVTPEKETNDRYDNGRRARLQISAKSFSLKLRIKEAAEWIYFNFEYDVEVDNPIFKKKLLTYVHAEAGFKIKNPANGMVSETDLENAQVYLKNPNIFPDKQVAIRTLVTLTNILELA